MKSGGNRYEFKYKMWQQAVDYAFLVHRDQKRADNKTPYVTHPLAVMTKVISKTDNIDTWIAAVLHDTIEDSEEEEQDKVYEEIEFKFGTEIANIVFILTRRKSAGESYDDYIERIMMSGNEQAILIKLKDIHHNLETLDSIPNEKKREESRGKYKKAGQRLFFASIEKTLSSLAMATGSTKDDSI